MAFEERREFPGIGISLQLFAQVAIFDAGKVEAIQIRCIPCRPAGQAGVGGSLAFDCLQPRITMAAQPKQNIALAQGKAAGVVLDADQLLLFTGDALAHYGVTLQGGMLAFWNSQFQ